jgi:hypothetical protein
LYSRSSAGKRIPAALTERPLRALPGIIAIAVYDLTPSPLLSERGFTEDYLYSPLLRTGEGTVRPTLRAQIAVGDEVYNIYNVL